MITAKTVEGLLQMAAVANSTFLLFLTVHQPRWALRPWFTWSQAKAWLKWYLPHPHHPAFQAPQPPERGTRPRGVTVPPPPRVGSAAMIPVNVSYTSEDGTVHEETHRMHPLLPGRSPVQVARTGIDDTTRQLHQIADELHRNLGVDFRDRENATFGIATPNVAVGVVDNSYRGLVTDLFRNGLLTLNEARARLGEPPLAEADFEQPGIGDHFHYYYGTTSGSANPLIDNRTPKVPEIQEVPLENKRRILE